ncbi:MAG: asparagine synthase (glutamine-hydrolyzing) [Pseudomonadota bacterium]|nr:asparagine synthase (glutamine-hydrolyzing) [Pseudomonadota bacterium]
MCGLAGILTRKRVEPQLLSEMAETIGHRGPDDQGTWWDQDAGIGFAHRRLSILDLSPLGHQPMASADGRFVMTYNGELYNHPELRAALDQDRATAWRGHSDTETLIECIAAWGLTDTLRRAVGMFALAVWDRRERSLYLARDRFGEKPLYYGWVGEDFAFASELKAIRRHPGFSNPVDRRAVRVFAGLAYIPAPLSIYERIYKLEPGCILAVGEGAWRASSATPPRVGESDGPLRLERYWSYREAVIDGLDDPINDEHEALERLEHTLSEAIRGQAVADVPVGAFLSGGIDSSLVVGLYQKYTPGTAKTFSIGFEEAAFNEAVYAKAVARHFGTDHHERYVTHREAQAVIPALPRMYDEPFADASQIPTHLVSAFAREQVTVALSGDGGDELFAGYNRYFATERLWVQLNRLPRPLRLAVGGSMARVPPAAWNAMAGLLPSTRGQAFFGTKVQKRFQTMRDAGSFEEVVASFRDEWAGDESPVLPAAPLPREGQFDMDVGPAAPIVTRMMYSDAVSYLPDDVLCKVDRAAMTVSLETRIPFLDHRVAEIAARIPLSMKRDNRAGKLILRRLLNKHAPRQLFERPKAGFAVPVRDWIKGPLRPWAEQLLDPKKMKVDGFFDPDIVHRRWRAHLSGQNDSTQALWSVLMFQAWLEENR